MVNGFHGRQTLEQGIHGVISFEYADAATRNAAGPFQSYDVNKLALQQDTDEVYILTDPSGPTWELFVTIGASGGVSSVFGRTGAVVAQTGDYDSDQIDNVSSVLGSTVSDALEQLKTQIVGGGGGTVSGPSTTTDNAIARWSGTDGYTIQNSGIIIDDSDNITGAGTINGVTIESHASRHETGGDDAIDGYNVDLVYSPSNYDTPQNNLIGEHIAAIDDELGDVSNSIVTDHGALTGLTDDDHTQYLLVSGSRAMSGDLDIGNNDIINVETINLNPLDPVTVTYQEGKIFYDNESHTLSVYNDKTDLKIQVGQDNFVRGVNKTGSTITNGSAVYINGVQGNKPTITLADASSDITAHAFGIAAHEILNNEEGVIITSGIVNEIDTSGFTAGDSLYISSITPGALTNIKPTGTNIVRQVALALNSTVNGSIFVDIITASHIDELHDIDDGTPTDGYYLRGNGSFWDGSDFSIDVVSVIDANQNSIDHGSVSGLTDDDHTQYLLVDGTRSMSGDLNVGSNNITNVSTVDGVDVSSHASRHESGGSDEIDGYNIDIVYTPSNYNAPQNNLIGEHIAAIDDELGDVSDSVVTDHGSLTGLNDDDHTQYLLADGTRALSGNLNLGSNNITNVGTVDGVDISNHSTRHESGGADAIDGYNVDFAYTPVNYNAPQNNLIGEHIAAIDEALATGGSGDVTSVFGRTGDVVAQTGDYDSDQVDNVSAVSGASVSDALETLNGLIVGGGSGTVSGPSTTTDNAIARWSGTDGYTIQNSGIIIDDSDNVTGAGTINGVTIESHASRHENGGADEINVDGLSGLLADSQTPLAHASTHITGGSDEVDGDQLDIDWDPSNYTPTTSPTEATSVDHLTAHLAGIDIVLGTIVTDHGNLTGLTDDDHTQYLLVDGTRSMSGSLNMGTNNITNVGTVDGVNISNHSARHESGGDDEIDGYNVALAYTPSNYDTPQNNLIGEHIAAIDDELGDVSSSIVTDHGNLTGLDDDDHTQYLLVSGSRAMSGALDMGTNNITNVGTVDGVDVSNHSTRHETGGADAIDGYNVDLVYTPSNYDAPQNNLIGEHISAIDDALAGAIGTGDVTGPGSSTDNAITRFDGTTGKIIQNSLVTIDDSGNMDLGSGNITTTGTVDGVDVSNHSARHENGGADEISVAGLSGLLADPQTPLSHASTHITGGSDEVDGDQLDIDWDPSNYTPTTSPTEATSVDHLTAHLAGIDTVLGTIVTDHGNLTGLDDDDHTQYLLVDGTRSMSGALNMGTNNITNVGTVDGVDISDHSARHESGGADAIEISNLGTSENDTSLVLKPDGLGGVEWTTDEVRSLDGYVFETRELIAGDGLTGGGDLSADRTFDVVANADGSIVVNANDIQVGILATDAQHGDRGGGSLHSVATTSVAGFMSDTDKTKLDGIESGAQENTVDSVFGRTGAVVALASDYNASQIDNDSGVPGTFVSDALDYLDDQISLIDLDGYALDADLQAHISDTNNPHSTSIGNIGSGTLAELNTAITDATLDDSSDSRTPTAHASTHETGGSDTLDGYNIELVYVPDNYDDPVNDLIGEHIAAIDDALAGAIGTGDVSGPESSTDNALARFDGTTGKTIQNSNATLTDAGALTLTLGLVVGGDIDVGSNSITNVNLVDGVDVSNHSARHENGGADEINVGGLSGLLADSQTPLAHASTHITGGSDEIDGDQLDIDWDPSNYTPTTSPTEATSVDHLTAHLAGIDTVLGTVVTDHGNLTGLDDDDHTQYLLVDGTRSMSGALNMGTNNITNVGTVDGVDISNHSTRHETGGADAIDGYNVDLVYAPVNYNAPQNDLVGEHISAIDDELGDISSSVVTDHGNLTGLTDDDHTQYLLVDGTRSMSGSLNMGTNNITNVGTVDGVDVSSHASRHENGGADEIDITGLSGEAADAQKVAVSLNSGATVGTRSTINFIEGSNITINVADDSPGDEVDITITASGGSGDVSGPGTHADNILPKFDGTDTNTIQTTGITIDDSNNITGAGNFNGVTVESHASRHENGGADAIDGYNLDLVYTPVNYDAPQNNLIGEHIAAIDDALGDGGGGGSGDVTGPASSTDNAIVRFDGTTGKTIQNSGITISDNDDIAGISTAVYSSEGDEGNSGSGSWNIDFSTNGQKIKGTLTGDASITFTFPGVGNYILRLIQDGTGSHTPSFPSSSRAASSAISIAGDADAVTVLAIYYDGTNSYISSMPDTGTSSPTVNLV